MRTVVISDCHLGAAEADSEALRVFLSRLECDRLIVAGDLWELWTRRPAYLSYHFHAFVEVFQALKKRGVALAYILGNHDETYLEDPLIPLDLLPVTDSVELQLPSGGKAAVIHGHEYDHLIKWHYPWMRLGYWAKQALRGLMYVEKRSVSSKRHDPKYSALAGEMHYKACLDYKKRGYAGLIMGHTHRPTISETGGFTFVNAGDWQGSNTFVEINEGHIELKSFKS